MFQFPAFASYTLCIQGKIPYDNAWKLEVFQPAPEPAEPPPHQRRRPSGLYCHPSFEVKQTSQTIQISQAFKVGFPIRRSMDQSLFAAPHGLSQRITSFIACACQGIHQMPLFHLIVLIANAHRLVAVPKERATDRVTFYNPAHVNNAIDVFDTTPLQARRCTARSCH